MEKSATISELAKALVSFQKEMKSIGFDANNPFFKSKYATLAQLVTLSKDSLAMNGLAVSQLAENEGSITTILMHVSGEYLMSTLTLKPVKDDPQGRGSCITYARRYSYASMLGLVADDDDDDGNTATNLTTRTATMPFTAKVQPNTEPKLNPTDEMVLTSEQGQALLAYLTGNGYTTDDLKEYISFQLDLRNLKEIKNKHLLQIKSFFRNKKQSEVKNG